MIATSFKRAAGGLANSRAFDVVLRRLETRRSSPRFLRVLAWHRVDHTNQNSVYYQGLISTTPESFEAQVTFLARNYHVVSMDDVVAAAKGEHTLPADAVQLTFDDATTDFAKYAWPVLRKLGLSATVFVPTAYPDNPEMHFWWDRLYRAVIRSTDGTTIPTKSGKAVLSGMKQRTQVFRHLKEYLKTIPHHSFQCLLSSITTAAGVPDPDHNNVLGWDQLKALHGAGLTLAPHTHTHPMLNQLSVRQVQDELVTSRKLLNCKLGAAPPNALAYPAGGVSNQVVAAMQASGFDLGYTTKRGLNDGLEHRFRLRRINVGARTTMGLMRLQLANWGK